MSKGSRQRTSSNEWFRKEHDRIFSVDSQVDCLKEFMKDDLENSQADVEDFIYDRKRNES